MVTHAQKLFLIQFPIENSTYVLSMKPINQVTVDPASYDDQVSINILDLILTQTFNYSLYFI